MVSKEYARYWIYQYVITPSGEIGQVTGVFASGMLLVRDNTSGYTYSVSYIQAADLKVRVHND